MSDHSEQPKLLTIEGAQKALFQAGVLRGKNEASLAIVTQLKQSLSEWKKQSLDNCKNEKEQENLTAFVDGWNPIFEQITTQAAKDFDESHQYLAAGLGKKTISLRARLKNAIIKAVDGFMEG